MSHEKDKPVKTSHISRKYHIENVASFKNIIQLENIVHARYSTGILHSAHP